MIKIFRPDISNRHFPLVLQSEDDRGKLSSLNFNTLSEVWEPVNFEFVDLEKKNWTRPDVTIILPCLAIRAELQKLIFPDGSPDVEFLPINASGEEWLLVNCLATTGEVNEKESVLYRDSGGQIFMIAKLVINDPQMASADCFTVDGSNRSYIYLTERLVDRFKRSGLKGVTFKEIGWIEG